MSQISEVKKQLLSSPTKSKPIDKRSPLEPQMAFGAYTARIISDDLNIRISAPLPEDFSFGISSNWSAPFEESMIKNSKIGGALSLGGYTGLIQAMTAQTWNSSSGIEISLPFVFVSRNNPLVEIRDPIMKLMKLASPRADTAFSLLTPPGPTITMDALKELFGALVDFTKNEIVTAADGVAGALFDRDAFFRSFTNLQSSSQIKSNINATMDNLVRNRIDLSLGRFIYFKNIIINGVELEFNSILSEAEFNNFPWRCTARVSFKTFVTPVLRDIENIFLAPPGA